VGVDWMLRSEEIGTPMVVMVGVISVKAGESVIVQDCEVEIGSAGLSLVRLKSLPEKIDIW
jgi:hypothetical protein